MKQLHNEENRYLTYTLLKHSAKIYVIQVADSYSRAMLFMRAQEFYETPLDQFRGKPFCIFDFMNQYRLNKQTSIDNFKYPEHWAGFNVPSSVLEKCYSLDATRDHFKGFVTPYDLMMYEIIKKIREDQPKGKFYLIGVDSEESNTMDHEIAHALYFTNPKYRAEMNELVECMTEPMQAKLIEILIQMGYRTEVANDEIQAFMSTGLYWKMYRVSGVKSISKKFAKIFKKYKQEHEKLHKTE
jgi:hypothetical protein